ncbi:MAG TPA: tail fiber assembly protein, partial [Acidimicrobiia bacterium]
SDYDTLEWYDTDQAKPTRDECDGEWQRLLPVIVWNPVRAKRDRLLAASDWTQVADAPVDQQAWAAYRQTLRDIPQDFATPDDVVWPEQP